MQEPQEKQNLLDTTDCLEAVSVFRCWKNFLFVIVACCLVLLQVSFWLQDVGLVQALSQGQAEPVVSPGVAQQIAAVGSPVVVDSGSEKIRQAAEKVCADPNESATPAACSGMRFPYFTMTFARLSWAIKLLNFLLILAVFLYCLTMLFALKISLLGRLGGINHISRAFFLSLVVVILLLPWQLAFGGVLSGVIYVPGELLASSSAAQSADIFGLVFYYLRFVGYWLLVMFLLMLSQFRSLRWTRATFRRLEVV